MLAKEHKPKFGYILIKFQMDKGEENSIYRLEKRSEGWNTLQLEYEFHPTAKLHECSIEDSIQSIEIELRLNRILKQIEKDNKIIRKTHRLLIHFFIHNNSLYKFETPT
jgi:hypothetical protein